WGATRHRDDMGERERGPALASVPAQHRVDCAGKPVAAGGGEQHMREPRVIVLGETGFQCGAFGVANADESLREKRGSDDARGSGKMATYQRVDIAVFQARDTRG